MCPHAVLVVLSLLLPPCCRLADPHVPAHSLLPSQSFAGLYNIPSPWTPGNAAVDVLHASRTLLWLKSEEALVLYDRATTLHSGKFKRFNMNFIAAPSIAGNTVTAIGKTNRAQVTSLLPANATITVQVSTITDNVIAGLQLVLGWSSAYPMRRSYS